MPQPFASNIGQEGGMGDTRKLWTIESSLQWGLRNGLEGQQLMELQEFATLMKNAELSSSDLKGGTTIDSGSFGIIEKAMLHGSPVAVKRFIKDQSGCKSLAQIVRDAHLELSILSATKHPHIVGFLGTPAYFPTETDTDQSMTFGFVFEFCAHGSLFSMLHEKQAKFLFEDKIRIAKELAMSLEYLHSELIIHRDVSSKNILITEDLRVKLADFGCARKVTGDVYQPTTISGNPPWMAPEQLGGKQLTFSADVWSFGVIFWELITEMLPWNDVPNDLWAMRQLVFEEGRHLPIPQISSNSPETKDEATAVAMMIKSMFLRQPSARPAMSSVFQGLQAIQEKKTREWVAGCISARKQNLEERLVLFFAMQQLQSQTIPTEREIGLLANLHCEDVDDSLLNLYLVNKYKNDLSIVGTVPQPIKVMTRADSGSTLMHSKHECCLCTACPHFYGEILSGYHELVLPDCSFYVGDLVNGLLHGLGILTAANGNKIQGEFRQNQLVSSFSVESMRSSLRPLDLGGTAVRIEERRLTELVPSESTKSESNQSNLKNCDDGIANKKELIKVEDDDSKMDAESNKSRKYSDRRIQLSLKLEAFCSEHKLSLKEDIDRLVDLYCEDADDEKLNNYLRENFNADLSDLQAVKLSPEPIIHQKLKSATYTCRECPHFFGAIVSGHHEICLPDSSRYVGDMFNGNFHGLGILTKSDGTKVQGQFENGHLIIPFEVDSIRCTLKSSELDVVKDESIVQQPRNDRVMNEPEGLNVGSNQVKTETIKSSVREGRMMTADRYNHLVSSCMEMEKQCPEYGSMPGLEHPVFELASPHHMPSSDITLHPRAYSEYSAAPAKNIMQAHGGNAGLQLNTGLFSGIELPHGTAGQQRNPGPAQTDAARIANGNAGSFSGSFRDIPHGGTPVPQYNFMQISDHPCSGTPGPQNQASTHLMQPSVLMQPRAPQNHHDGHLNFEQSNAHASATQYPHQSYVQAHTMINIAHHTAHQNFAYEHQRVGPLSKEVIPDQRHYMDGQFVRPPLTESRIEHRQNVIYGGLPTQRQFTHATVSNLIGEKRRLVEGNGAMIDTGNSVYMQNGPTNGFISYPNVQRWQ